MPDDRQSSPLALLVTRNFPPLLGGMEKVNQHLLAALRPIWRTALCGPAGCAEYVPPETEVRQSRVKPLPAFVVAALWHTVHLAWRRKPEWVIAGSGLTAPIAWLAARCAGGRAAVYLHGLDVVAPSRAYQWLWLPFIRRCDLALVNSANTARLAHGNGVRSDRLHVLHPGTDLPELDAKAARDFRERHGFGQRPLLLSVGRLTQRKGLAEFVAKALPIIVSHYREALLVVIGDEASDALHTRTGSERERILAAARDAGVERNLRFLGRCDEATLGAAYQAANLHIFPVLELPGDVEGFGMVALESAAHGLPTIAFAVGGVSDAVQDGRTGTLIETGDYGSLGEAVIRQLAQTSDGSTTAICRDFAAGKAWPAFGERLRKLLGAPNV
ncbi:MULTISPECIES: glycosyltransferase family 4 protein [unclassified Rhodanobacter]|uniref:glycosyltransferase family 4 protein n=1 Tax=unclassified Rhodanobacter TaxID=2621553 RepID=UPI001BDE3F7C|nr:MULTISPECIES: glycosyltransferase family 4 protein [unclassified Rhodanobacter]MBT2143295.1 glycosyltransferase family 4 protein [Rhodanobacter sp. LX-99]MBT2147631.1 glycosyltransferase family 4 protein [Rhodanobacter sp. LX-100]